MNFYFNSQTIPSKSLMQIAWEKKNRNWQCTHYLSVMLIFIVFFTLCRAASGGFFSDNTTAAKEIDGTRLPRLVHSTACFFSGNTTVAWWGFFSGTSPSPASGCCDSWFSFFEKNSNLPLRPSLLATPQRHDTPPIFLGASHFFDCRSAEMSCQTTSYASLIQRPFTEDQLLEAF